MTSANPFQHHPGLADLITPPEASQLRDITADKIRPMLEERGLDTSWLRSPEENERERAAILAQRPDPHLWVFAYGSLIWDPAFYFSVVLRAFAPDWQRLFVLKDTVGGRGTLDAPGVMAALDHGTGCHGVVLKIDAHLVEQETRVIWSRERLGPAYHPKFIETETKLGRLTALTFVADHSSPVIAADMSEDEQIRYCATGSGFMGTSLDYLTYLAIHFEELGIEDAGVTGLLAKARAYRSGLAD